MPRSSRSLRTAMYSVMRSLTSSRPAWSSSSTDARAGGVELLLGALRPRHRDQPVEVGADHRALARLLAAALEAAQLLRRLLGDVLGHLGLGDLLLVLGDHVAVVVAQLLADRLHLLAQEVLALLGLGAVLDVVADAGADLKLGEALALQLDRELEALGDVDRLEQALLVLAARCRGCSPRCRRARPAR